ncbi:helix-turn-helix transcriptional regulator [Actinosynnema sp. NPDC020468]|uniref:helix-turn-helix domain-containing protein n=1 Tax=Actinosynnema sp. NPDC020468 TaxID=3154488 RepID=UPI0033FE8749
MVADPGPVVQRLIFGSRVRQLRTDAGVELETANDQLGWYRGKLSKVETGLLATKPQEVEDLIEMYKIRASVANEIRKLGRDARRVSAPERVPDSARQYIALERAATDIWMVYGEIPGLFQTTEFARAQLRSAPTVTSAHVDEWAAAREERGEQLRKPGAPTVWVVLGEPALDYLVGGPEVLRRQLERMAELSSLPNVHLKLFPYSAGHTPGLSVPFTLLWIEPASVHIAYAETLTASEYIKSTGAYRVAFDNAYQRALSEDETQTVLERRIHELE